MTTPLRLPYDLDDATYDLYRDLVLERTGIHFGPRRRGELARGVRTAAAPAAGGDLAGYFDRLRAADTSSLVWDDLIGEISIGESYFFRDHAQMLALRTVILPALIARHRDDRTLRIWSAGCSTGEEPCSVAMLLVDLLDDAVSWNLTILATDINRRALSQAATGRYREWSFRTTDPAARARHFSADNGLFVLRPEIRNMVVFGYLNLAAGAYPSLVTQTNALDLILWRNVAIYLPPEVVRTVAERLHQCLLPDGYLIVGAAEANALTYQRFTTLTVCGTTVYQKTSARPAVPEAALPARISQPPNPPPRQPQRQPTPRLAPPPPAPVDSRTAYDEGMALQRARQPEGALAAFAASLTADPTFAPAHHALARIHANRGDLVEARRRCEQALRHDPALAEAHYTLALICVESGRQDEAVACLRKALYLAPEFALAHFSLANILERAGRSQDAARHRRHALRIAAALPEADVVAGSDDLTGAQLQAMLTRAAEPATGTGSHHG